MFFTDVFTDVTKSGNTNLFHDLKQRHSLEHAESKK